MGVMKYISAAEFADKHGIAERTARHYCACGKIDGAFLTGKTWNIPQEAPLPTRKPKRSRIMPLLSVLQEQMAGGLKGGIYHHTQIHFTYNTNHIEGSKLTEEQTRHIFETQSLIANNDIIHVDDLIETSNHFRCVDYIIRNAQLPLTESMICELHAILKTATSDDSRPWFAVGAYKKYENEVAGRDTTPPALVRAEMKKLLQQYHRLKKKTLDDIISFHHSFECIHPFQDGNGRIGRLIMFKECLAHNIVPFIITEELKLFYYRGLAHWPGIPGYLRDTILTAQDDFRHLMRKFRIDE